MFKRITLFLGTNLLVIGTISIIMSLLGVGPYLTSQGINYTSLLIFCTLWGMGGAFISLFLSKFMAKKMMGVKIIDPNTPSGKARDLLNMVYRLAERAGIPRPEVGIYNSPEVNAFATGASKKSSLVAVSTGLLDRMNAAEVEGVIGHELSHIANGDMITMTLIQGVVNAFSLFLSRVVAYAISTALRDEGGRGFSLMTYYLLSFVFDILFTLLGSILVCAFSRWREFHADAGGAKLTGTSNMVAALKQLQNMSSIEQDKRGDALNSLKIAHRDGWMSWFATHPPLEERIARLERKSL